MKDKIDFYLWRIKIVLCYFKHDFKVVYTRSICGGEKDGHYSGKVECQRCFKYEYFAGIYK